MFSYFQKKHKFPNSFLLFKQILSKIALRLGPLSLESLIFLNALSIEITSSRGSSSYPTPKIFLRAFSASIRVLGALMEKYLRSGILVENNYQISFMIYFLANKNFTLSNQRRRKKIIVNLMILIESKNYSKKRLYN